MIKETDLCINNYSFNLTELGLSLNAMHTENKVSIANYQGIPFPPNLWCMLHIPPISAKFTNFPPSFFVFLFWLPYFKHDAFMHYALHILGSPGLLPITVYYLLAFS